MKIGIETTEKENSVARFMVNWPGTAGWLMLLALSAVVIAAAVRQAAGGAIPTTSERDRGLAAAMDALLKNSGRPRDQMAVQEAAANLLVILNPEVTQREARKNPAFVQAEAEAAASFFNPGALHAKRMEDPAYRRRYEAVMESLRRQARATDYPIVPSATDAKQIEALRNNPEWRRRREEGLRAALPRIPRPGKPGGEQP